MNNKKAKLEHGGTRQGAGRPRIHQAPRKAITVRLTEAQIDAINKVWGSTQNMVNEHANILLGG